MGKKKSKEIYEIKKKHKICLTGFMLLEFVSVHEHNFIWEISKYQTWYQ